MYNFNFYYFERFALKLNKEEESLSNAREQNDSSAE